MSKPGISVNVNFPDQQTGRSTREAKMDIRTSVFFGAELTFTKGDFMQVVVSLDESDIERLEAALAERKQRIAECVAEEAHALAG
jgi:hypothetical protein